MFGFKDLSLAYLSYPIGPKHILTYCPSDSVLYSYNVLNRVDPIEDTLRFVQKLNNGPLRETSFTRARIGVTKILTLPKAAGGIPSSYGPIKIFSYLGADRDSITSNDTITTFATVPTAQSLPIVVAADGLQAYISRGFIKKNPLEGDSPARYIIWATKEYYQPEDSSLYIRSDVYRYINKKPNTIESPTFKFTAGAHLKFMLNLWPENGRMREMNLATDSLLVRMRQPCGQWQNLRTFSMADLQNNTIDSVPKEFEITLNPGGADSLQIDFGYVAPLLVFNRNNYGWALRNVQILDGPVASKATKTEPILLIVPNPAKGSVKIELPFKPYQNARIRIVSTSGRLQSEDYTNARETTVKLDGNMANGLYILKCKRAVACGIQN